MPSLKRDTRKSNKHCFRHSPLLHHCNHNNHCSSSSVLRSALQRRWPHLQPIVSALVGASGCTSADNRHCVRCDDPLLKNGTIVKIVFLKVFSCDESELDSCFYRFQRYERLSQGRGHEMVLDEMNVVTGPVRFIIHGRICCRY